VYARHPFPLWQRVGFVAAGLLVGLRRPEYGLGDGRAAFLGRLEGLFGRTFGQNVPHGAVVR
jgi:hypothetical protein